MRPDPYAPDSWWFVPWLVGAILLMLTIGLVVVLVVYLD